MNQTTKIECESCKIILTKRYIKKHRKTNKHIKNYSAIMIQKIYRAYKVRNEEVRNEEVRNEPNTDSFCGDDKVRACEMLSEWDSTMWSWWVNKYFSNFKKADYCCENDEFGTIYVSEDDKDDIISIYLDCKSCPTQKEKFIYLVIDSSRSKRVQEIFISIDNDPKIFVNKLKDMLKYIHYNPLKELYDFDKVWKEDLEQDIEEANSFAEENDMICPVCYETTFYKTQCGHCLCMNCAYELRENSCPLCRRELYDNNKVKFDDIKHKKCEKDRQSKRHSSILIQKIFRGYLVRNQIGIRKTKYLCPECNTFHIFHTLNTFYDPNNTKRGFVNWKIVDFIWQDKKNPLFRVSKKQIKENNFFKFKMFYKGSIEQECLIEPPHTEYTMDTGYTHIGNYYLSAEKYAEMKCRGTVWNPWQI
jgi:hypothetical protein